MKKYYECPKCKATYTYYIKKQHKFLNRSGCECVFCGTKCVVKTTKK